jgi:NAD(P)-dependent dehydrogenase (short-subunit alcohol dehydrogenase family)
MSALFDLRGQTALVTGASCGLGQYFSRALARAGADLIVTSRKADDLAPFCEEIEALGRKATPLALWNARLFLYQLRSDRTGIRGVFDDTREEAYSGADREPVAAG